MKSRNLTVNEHGIVKEIQIAREWDLLENPYRFYRFLTDIENILAQTPSNIDILPKLHQLVRKLVINSYWVTTQIATPDPKTGIGICNLYDEIGFPLTVQTVTFAPGVKSSIHNHGTWGVVAVFQGQEKNSFWRRENSAEYPGKINLESEITLQPGDVISFEADAIHCVEAVGTENLVTFNIYGETNHKLRFEFCPLTNQVKNY